MHPFVIASRHSGARARHRGTRVLIEGCVIQVAGLAALTLTVAWVEVPTAPLLELVLAISFFAIEAARSARLALFASSALFALSIAACAAFLAWMRRAAPEI